MSRTSPRSRSSTTVSAAGSDRANGSRSLAPCEPGQPNALYHAEDTQEGFLVVAGECRAIVEGEELRLHQWDYLHCPPDTPHVMIGAGSEPCAILMVGAPRTASLDEMRYSTRSSFEAYLDRRAASAPERFPWPLG